MERENASSFRTDLSISVPIPMRSGTNFDFRFPFRNARFSAFPEKLKKIIQLIKLSEKDRFFFRLHIYQALNMQSVHVT